MSQPLDRLRNAGDDAFATYGQGVFWGYAGLRDVLERRNRHASTALEAVKENARVYQH